MLGAAASYAGNRKEMEAMGAVYRALRDALPRDEVELTVVDPRNTAWLLPVLWRDARRRGLAPREAWRQVTRGISYNAVVVDGRVLFSGHVPEPHAAVAAVRAELEAA